MNFDWYFEKDFPTPNFRNAFLNFTLSDNYKKNKNRQLKIFLIQREFGGETPKKLKNLLYEKEIVW